MKGQHCAGPFCYGAHIDGLVSGSRRNELAARAYMGVDHSHFFLGAHYPDVGALTLSKQAAPFSYKRHAGDAPRAYRYCVDGSLRWLLDSKRLPTMSGSAA